MKRRGDPITSATKARKLFDDCDDDDEWSAWVFEADSGKKLVPTQAKHPEQLESAMKLGERLCMSPGTPPESEGEDEEKGVVIGRMTLWERVKKQIEETVFASYDAEHDEWIRACRGEPDYSRGYVNVTFYDEKINKALREAAECFQTSLTDVCVRLYTPIDYEDVRHFEESDIEEHGCKTRSDLHPSAADPETCLEHDRGDVCVQELPFDFTILLEALCGDKKQYMFQDGDGSCEAVEIELPCKMKVDGTLVISKPFVQWGM